MSNHFTNSITNCYADLNLINTEKNDYGFGWSPFSSVFSPQPYFSDAYRAFQYTKALKISSFPQVGTYTTYLGGGYVYKMNGNKSELLSNLTLLEQNNWIDAQTRALLIELNLFNPNINMFAYGYMLFEFLPVGSIVKSSRFYPMTLFDSRNSLYSFGTVCALIYLVIIFLITMKQIYLIKIHKMKYFKRFWTYLDLSIIAFSFTAFAIWLYRIWEAQNIMGILASKYSSNSSSKFINLQMLAYWDDVLASMLAFCACLGSFKFFKILQINRSIQTLSRTLKIGFVGFLGFGFIFALMVFAWLQVGFVIFNDRIQGFSTFVKTVETGFLLILGKMQLKDMMDVNPLFAALFHLSFNFFMVMIMLHMFISLITDAFALAKLDEKNGEKLHMEKFIYHKIESVFMHFKKKLSSDESKAIEEHERKMKLSLAQKDMYQDEVANFEYKTNEIISKFNYFGVLNSKEAKILK